MKSYPDDDRAGEEEVLELVGVAVGAHVEEVLVTAELLEGEAAPVKAAQAGVNTKWRRAAGVYTK